MESRKFFATCWVMVEAPIGRLPEPRLRRLTTRRAQDAGDVDAVVLVEVLVLGRKERRLDEVGHRLDRQIEPPLARVLGDQLAVGRVDARHHRRLVLRQAVVVGQVGVERLQKNARGHSETEKHEGSYPEDVAKNP